MEQELASRCFGKCIYPIFIALKLIIEAFPPFFAIFGAYAELVRSKLLICLSFCCYIYVKLRLLLHIFDLSVKGVIEESLVMLLRIQSFRVYSIRNSCWSSFFNGDQVILNRTPSLVVRVELGKLELEAILCLIEQL